MDLGLKDKIALVTRTHRIPEMCSVPSSEPLWAQTQIHTRVQALEKCSWLEPMPFCHACANVLQTRPTATLGPDEQREIDHLLIKSPG